MSYVRWSSVIGSDYSFEEMIKDIQEGALCTRDMTKRQLETPGSYKSKWYIFWHCGYTETETNNREDQLLAIWLQGEQVTPVLEYDVVKEMYERDAWHELPFSEVPQKEVLLDCVKSWLDDVDEAYG